MSGLPPPQEKYKEVVCEIIDWLQTKDLNQFPEL